MIALLDVNLLVALAWPNHVHHAIAIRWFRANSRTGWATCPLTQSGFVRVSSNRRAIPNAVTPADAIGLLRHIIAQPDHSFWDDAISIAQSKHVTAERLTGHQQITDAHLLALALSHSGRLATTDRGVVHLLPSGANPTQVVTVT